MGFTKLRIPGSDAIRLLHEHRSRYQATGLYPFLIGDAEELARIEDGQEFDEQDTGAIIRASLEITSEEWIASRRIEAEEYAFSADDLLGDWPGEIHEKGSICLHQDLLSRKIKSEVYLGLAAIEQPWHLPAIVKYGGWNDCPEPEVQCAFYRKWQEMFGVEITGMSGDVVECTVRRPPLDQNAAMQLAWDQYWYCGDIVDQGCGSVSNLGATLLNSPYWFFWWD